MLRIALSVLLMFMAPAVFAEDTPKKETHSMKIDMGIIPYLRHGSATIDFRNKFDKDLTMISRTIQGTDFSFATNCPKVMAPGKVCQIRFNYFNGMSGLNQGLFTMDTSEAIYKVYLTAFGDYEH